MRKHLAAAREAVACLADGPERARALHSLESAQAEALMLPEDPMGNKAATDAYIKSLEQRVEHAEHSEQYLLRACKRLQESVAEYRALAEATS